MICFTVASHGNAKDASGYINYDSVEFDNIPDMTTNGTNYCACKLVDNYRLDNNFDGNVDVLIIDIDEVCTIKEAEILFAKYEFFIIPSKSHQKSKGGVICDRFRIFFHLDKTIHIREHMEMLYSEFIHKYPFIDTSCRNVSRFFYSSPRDAIVIHNKGRKYPTKLTETGQIDTLTVSPKQDYALIHKDAVFVFCEIREQWVNSHGETLESDSLDDDSVKLRGVDTFLENEYYQGQKGNTLFRASSMMKKDGFSDDFIMDYLVRYWQSKSASTDKMKDCLQNVRGGLKT